MKKISFPQCFLVGLIMVASFTLGCNQSHPGNWDEVTVETKLREKISLSTLDLSPAAGGFSGSGTDADGQAFDLTVKQDANTKSLSYVAKGNRGDTQEGSIAFD